MSRTHKTGRYRRAKQKIDEVMGGPYGYGPHNNQLTDAYQELQEAGRRHGNHRKWKAEWKVKGRRRQRHKSNQSVTQDSGPQDTILPDKKGPLNY